VFFGFWLSHVPASRFDAFWTDVQTALEPGGSAFFVDSLPEPTSAANDQGSLDVSGIMRRRLREATDQRGRVASDE
jgi:demethylmenaquinone methyltransferase/2-methoxy-6-polyprenyl-1,4-benzoquinol methylase